MRKTADATVIGGGAIATSTLYHVVSKLGLRNVVLRESGVRSSFPTYGGNPG